MKKLSELEELARLEQKMFPHLLRIKGELERRNYLLKKHPALKSYSLFDCHLKAGLEALDLDSLDRALDTRPTFVSETPYSPTSVDSLSSPTSAFEREEEPGSPSSSDLRSPPASSLKRKPEEEPPTLKKKKKKKKRAKSEKASKKKLPESDPGPPAAPVLGDLSTPRLVPEEGRIVPPADLQVQGPPKTFTSLVVSMSNSPSPEVRTSEPSFRGSELQN